MVEPIYIQKEDQGKHFKVPIGSGIMLLLPEIPTSGYRWEIEETDEMLQLESTKLAENSAEEETRSIGDYPDLQLAVFAAALNKAKFGGSKIRQFEFTAASAGVVYLTLKHWCAWDNDVQERFTVIVDVCAANELKATE